MTVGSSPNTSSPTSASAMAFRIPAEGRVTVSLRRSIIVVHRASLLRACELHIISPRDTMCIVKQCFSCEKIVQRKTASGWTLTPWASQQNFLFRRSEGRGLDTTALLILTALYHIYGIQFLVKKIPDITLRD